tara:strand:- start:588 stop:812 length:225 start_codon:yes stop_codon:yes gene_type:complete
MILAKQSLKRVLALHSSDTNDFPNQPHPSYDASSLPQANPERSINAMAPKPTQSRAGERQQTFTGYEKGSGTSG